MASAKSDPLTPDVSLASNAMKSAHVDAVELIAAIRARPCLWDRECITYRHRATKEAAWHQVCATIEPSFADLASAERHELESVLMRKWYNIRDAYKKNYHAKNTTRPYVYSNLLTFLNPFIKERIKPGSASQHEDDEPDEKDEWLNVFDFERTELTPPPKKARPQVEYRVKENEVETDESVIAVLVNLLEKEEDEDRAFFKSITPAVKSLSDEAKFLFRIQVMKLLNSLRKKARVKIEMVDSDSD